VRDISSQEEALMPMAFKAAEPLPVGTMVTLNADQSVRTWHLGTDVMLGATITEAREAGQEVLVSVPGLAVENCRVGEHSFGSGMEALVKGMRKFGMNMSDLTGWTCSYCKAACSGSVCKNCGAPMPGGGR